MAPLSTDTPLEIERVWLAMQRERGPLWRLRRCAELTSLCWRAAQKAVERAHSDATPRERDLILLTERYGEGLARGFVAKREEIRFYG